MDDVISGGPVKGELEERREMEFSHVIDDQDGGTFDTISEVENVGGTELGFGDFSFQTSLNAIRSVWDDLLSDSHNEADPEEGSGDPSAAGPRVGGGDSAACWGLEFDNDFDASAAGVWSPPGDGKTKGSEFLFGDVNEAAPEQSDWAGFDVKNGNEAEGEGEEGEGNAGKKEKEEEDWFGKGFEVEARSGQDSGYDPFLVGNLVTDPTGGVFAAVRRGEDILSGPEEEDDPLDDFDPRAGSSPPSRPHQDAPSSSSDGTSTVVSRSRPRPKTTGASKPTNPFNIALREAAVGPWDHGGGDEDEDGSDDPTADPFNFDADLRIEPSEKNNPFAEGAKEERKEEEERRLEEEEVETTSTAEWNAFPGQQQPPGEEFNPFATIVDDGDVGGGGGGGGGGTGAGFDPFQTIHDDDAFVLPTERVTGSPRGPAGEALDDPNVSPSRFNPFDKEPPLPEQFASLTPVVKVKPDEPIQSPMAGSSENSVDETDADDLEPLDPFYADRDPDRGWNLLLRQPFKKKLTQNRFWKPAHVRLMTINDNPFVRVYANDKDPECLHELALQPTFTLCEMGLQQLDQFGKCHTVKIQQVSYKESVGVKSERIAPTISDLTRVRDFKSLKDLVHKPKATMILDHAPHATEVLKFGGLDYKEFKEFIHSVEDILFALKSIRGKSASYTKDEITVDVQDEYYAEIDKDGHIAFQKARVRLFCLAFLSESPMVEVGINDRKRRGKEVVGRRDIIPIKTEEWIRTEDPQLHSTVETAEFEKTKAIRFNPLDACHFELMRFRVRLRPNLELPLQIRVRTSVVDRHVEVRTEVMVTGYYSNSRRAAQTPCEDIQIRFPIPEPWIYLFRVEKRFKYGAVHSSTRKPGKIKGLERLTMFAQGILPASLIEVSSGLAKYENAFQAVVWRMDQLPERNEGAYKTHLMVINLDLAPHDSMPEELDRYVRVEYSMSNSTVSRAQVRSIAISGVDEPPDRWVRHLARYEYKLEIEFTDKMKAESEDVLAPVSSAAPTKEGGGGAEGTAPTATAEDDDSEASSTDSD